MDSGNSGSIQSSSTAGDEEYDSRSDPSFLTNKPVPPPQPTTLTTTNVGFHHHVFDPLSNYLDPTQQRPQSHPNPNQILNLDMVWSKVARSEPDLAALIPSPSSSSPHNNNQAFLFTQLGESQSQSQTHGGGGGVVNVGVSGFPTTLPLESASPRGGFEQNSTNTNTNTNVVRNPKKRSRASRRAPTTVLTTDTTNFRAMVQEFTGIPAPPFTSSPFPRTRLDLFAPSNASSSSALRSASTHLEQQPPTPTPTPHYLLRPFAHKVQAQPSSSIPHNSFPPMLNMNTLASNNNNNNNNSGSNSTSIHYQHHPLNMHNNPILSLQSILGNNNSSVLVGSKTQQQPSLEITPSAVDSHLKMVGLEELGLSHAHVGGHHHPHQNINMNMVSPSSDGALSRVNNMRGPSSADWAQAQRIGGNNDGTLNYRNNVSDQRVKVNFSATTTPSDFHGEKAPPECAVAARSEGMVESWINCSSD